MADPSHNVPGRVVIVGAGHGGGTAAALLRQEGFEGDVILIGEEAVGPYHRPPLSKSLLKDELEQPLKPEQFYRDQGIELRTHSRVTAVDREARAVLLAGGESVPYDVLILATGAVARQLPIPGIELEGVHELRTLTDARVLEDALGASRRLAIVGGGFIGLEVAASARSAGVEVTVIEREQRLLERVASEALSAHLTEHHLRHGTDRLVGAHVSGLAGDDGRVCGVELEEGHTVECDRVLVGVGAVANDALARAAGLPCEDGVPVDLSARTTDPRIYAVGDVTRRPLTFHEGLFRLESIPSAVEQARQAVAAILGKPAPAPEVPWFWSDQFDLKLKIAGLILDADRVTTRTPGVGALALFHTRQGRLLAAETVNAPAEFMAAKHMLREGIAPDLERLADAGVRLEEIVPGMRQEVQEPAAAPSRSQPGPRSAIPAADRRPGCARVTYIQADGARRTVEVPEGLSLMEGSVRNNVPGIIAECGGMCSCGTCHVYVVEEWRDRLDEPEYEESEMLEFLEGARESSRLSCQIPVTGELDGIAVHVPEFEG